MHIGLIDVDSHNYPNLAIMKLSAYHKSIGDTVEWWYALEHYDRVYMSKVFDNTYSPDIPEPMNADEVIRGGTGYGLDNPLPDYIEHIYPDYDLYPQYTKDTAYGLLTRGCPRGCEFCIVGEKEGRRSVKVADLSEWWNGQKFIELLDPNLLACRDRDNLLEQLRDSKAYVNFSQGLDCRLLTEEIVLLLDQIKKKELHFAWDKMSESESVLRGLNLYKSISKKKLHGRHATVYTLVNKDTTMDENLYRIYKLNEMGYEPYVMVYDKPNAPKEIIRLQRWCNNKWVFRKCPNFDDYKKGQPT